MSPRPLGAGCEYPYSLAMASGTQATCPANGQAVGMDNADEQGWKPESHRRGAQKALISVVGVVGGIVVLLVVGFIVLAVLYAAASSS